MGFFDFFRNLFAPSLDEKLKRISRRIDELRNQKTSQLKPSKQIDDEQFDIDTKKSKINLNIFEPHQLSNISTMQSLKDRRIELEQKRLDELKEQVLLNFASIRNLIGKEEPKKAKKLLVETFSSVKELKETQLLESYQNLLSEVADLEEALRQKEIERKRRERELEEEAQRKKEEAERIRKQKEEEEKLRKQREAREYEERLKAEAQKRELERNRLIAEVTCKKDNAQRFLDYLERKGVRYFYHFTDEQNIASIRKHKGLFSWYYCENNDIRIPNAGGSSQSRSLDRRHGLQDYVRLSFCDDHPMAYRLHLDGARLVLLKIKVDVAAFKDTQFSNMNAADNAVQHGNTFEDLQRVNINATQAHFVSRNDDIFSAHQAECMVKTFIPIEYIVNIDNPQRMHFG